MAATNTATGATAFLPYSSTLVPSILSPNRYTSYAGFSMPAFPGLANSPIGPLQPQAAYSAPDTSQLLSWGTQATVKWKVNDTLALTSISGFRGYSSSWYHDGDASLWPLQLSGEYLQHHQFSQELRLNGSVGKLLDYTWGGFYFNENTIYGSHEDLWFAAGPGALNFLSNDPVPAKDKAAFLHTVWHLTDQLNFIAGVRYTSQSKDYTYVRVNPEGGTGGSASLVGSLTGVTGHYSANKTDYRAGLDYQWTDNLMTYAQVSTGFKGGGVNPRPFFAFQAVPFQPETVTTYEFGTKSQWFNNTLRVNLDGYYSKYNDIQLTLLNCGFLNPPGFPIPPAATPCALPYNTGNADIKGVELEVQAQPMAGLEIDAMGSYLNFHYTNLSSFPTGVTTSMTTPYRLGVGGHVEGLGAADPGDGAGGDVAHRVAAGLPGGDAHRGQAAHDVGCVFHVDEMKLDVLAGGDVGDPVRVFLGQVGDRFHLFRSHAPPGELDALHAGGVPMGVWALPDPGVGIIQFAYLEAVVALDVVVALAVGPPPQAGLGEDPGLHLALLVEGDLGFVIVDFPGPVLGQFILEDFFPAGGTLAHRGFSP